MIRILMILTLSCAILAFGGTPDWARAAIITATGVLAIAGGMMQFRRPADRITFWDLVAAGGFALVCAYVYFQAMPGSASLVPWPSASADSAKILGTAPLDTISVSPIHTIDALIWLMTLGGWFALSLMTSQRHDRFGQLGLWAVVGLAVTFAFYGLMLRTLGLEVVLWHEKEAYLGTLTGPFINRNHFATLLAIGLVCTTALMFEIRDRPAAQSRMADAGVGSSTAGIRWDRLIALLICWAVLGTALVFTQSRGGMASAVFGLAIMFGAAMLIGMRGILIGLGLGAVAVGGAVTLFAINSETISERFYFADWALDGRMALYDHIWQIAQKYPWTGTGLGTFEAVFRMNKPDVVTQYFDYAHNSYLELAFEIGLPATILLLAVFGFYALSAVKAIRTLRHKPATALAATGAMAVIGMHAFADFSIQIPAIALVILFLLGNAIGQARLARR